MTHEPPQKAQCATLSKLVPLRDRLFEQPKVLAPRLGQIDRGGKTRVQAFVFHIGSNLNTVID